MVAYAFQGMKVSLLPSTAAAITLLLLLIACERSDSRGQPWYKGQVEVAPDIFIEVNGRSASSDDSLGTVPWERLHSVGTSRRGRTFSETYEMNIKWHESTVHWKGNSVPLNLRALGEQLYLITFDRVSLEHECTFRYFAQDADELREVDPGAFPRSIAGQNMDFGDRYFGGLDRQRDSVQIARDQDPEDLDFQSSQTAYIWNQLATGERYEQSLDRWLINRQLLEDYIRTNKPVKLTRIVRESGSGRPHSEKDNHE